MDLRRMIDHTLLKPEASAADIRALCAEAVERDFKAVCIPPRFIRLAKEELKNSNTLVCTVIGFPLGYNSTAIKAAEAKDAVEAGADEIDMVIAIGALKEADRDYVKQDIQAVREVTKDRVLKVILETSLLTEEEIRTGTKISVDAGADFVKTSTGFSTGGASVDAVRIMKETAGDQAEIKASGGIRDKETAIAMIKAGATRLGTSSGMALTEKA